MLEQKSAAERSISVAFPDTTGANQEYEVVVGPGVLARVPALLAERCPAHRYALIADQQVADLYADSVSARLRDAGMRVDLFTFPVGERFKTREVWAELSDRMLASGLGRDAAVIALGGGVTGDLAGFVAATFVRGVPLVQVPTTLLAMIDSSVGGKTGVDTPAGKNLIGAFLQPRLVIADVETLQTLPAEHFRNGLAEAVKHGAIADAEYFEFLEATAGGLMPSASEAIVELIGRSVGIKAGVVSRDEREAGLRQVLNFGHTVGHAVELLSGFQLLHGEAVSIGMVAEARLGECMGITEAGTARRLQAVLEQLHLPTFVPSGMAADEIVDATRTDKKARGGRVEYSLIERVGAASPGPTGRWSVAVNDREVLEVLR